MIAAANIRALRAADIRPLGAVLARAYASPHNFELPLEGYLQRRAAVTFVADFGGRPAGIVIGNDYGATAYVSMMGVDPALQRHGIGRALMSGLLAWARERRFAAVELDATPKGAALYAGFGFVEAGATLVYGAAGRGGKCRGVRRCGAADRAALLAADRRAFGAERGDVLGPLLESPFNAVFVCGARGAVDGYAVAQPRSELLGPVVAPDAEAAARLIDAARAHLPAGHRLNVPSTNRAAQALLAARGYGFSRSLAHMLLGTPPRAARERIFARVNLGHG
ncbi:MAG: GNAT family N-acetyltransferase [Candidatus Velthaea sp.]|jgi:ribosomal protein S18 acetylase RimI-like enzyme